MAFRIKAWTIVFLTILLAAGFYFGSGKLVSHIEHTNLQSDHGQSGFFERAGSAANFSTNVSNVERLNRWHASLAMFSERPFFGFGPGTYQFTYIPYQKESLKNRLTVTDPINVPENSGGTAHSEYLLAMSEMGLLGLLGWLALLGKLFMVVFSKKFNNYQNRYLIAATVAVSTYFFHSLFNNFLGVEKIAFLFWACLAFVNVNSEVKNGQNVL
jgi:O-antigen ligase